jgi:hypothetical protein
MMEQMDGQLMGGRRVHLMDERGDQMLGERGGLGGQLMEGRGGQRMEHHGSQLLRGRGSQLMEERSLQSEGKHTGTTDYPSLTILTINVPVVYMARYAESNGFEPFGPKKVEIYRAQPLQCPE